MPNCQLKIFGNSFQRLNILCGIQLCRFCIHTDDEHQIFWYLRMVLVQKNICICNFFIYICQNYPKFRIESQVLTNEFYQNTYFSRFNPYQLRNKGGKNLTRKVLDYGLYSRIRAQTAFESEKHHKQTEDY